MVGETNQPSLPQIIAPSAADPELKPGPLCSHSGLAPELQNNQDTGLRSEEREDLAPAARYELLALGTADIGAGTFSVGRCPGHWGC